MPETPNSSRAKLVKSRNSVGRDCRSANRMESKDSALLHFGSRFPSSAPRTGQARFRASGAPIPAGESIFASIFTFRYGSLLLPVRFLGARNISTPSPCVRLSWTPWVVVTPPTTTGPLSLLHHWRSVRLPRIGRCFRFRRCSHSTFSVSFRCPSVILTPGEPGREAYPHG
jgi:hypothetical protein